MGEEQLIKHIRVRAQRRCAGRMPASNCAVVSNAPEYRDEFSLGHRRLDDSHLKEYVEGLRAYLFY